MTCPFYLSQRKGGRGGGRMQAQPMEKPRPKGKGRGPRAQPLLDFLVAGTSPCGWQVFGTGWATMRRLFGTVEAFSSSAHPAWAPALQAPQPCVCIGQPFPTTGPRGQSLLRAEYRRHPELARLWPASSRDLPRFSARPGDWRTFSRAAQLPASP